MKRIAIGALMLAALSFGSCANNNSDTTETTDSTSTATAAGLNNDNDREDDSTFAVEAAGGGMMEVQFGQLATKNAASTEVRKFGQMMVDDHSKANEELKALAAQKNIPLPTTLPEDKQKMYDELSQKKGAEFDEAYMDMMVDDHKEDIDAFQKEADHGNDPDLKNWAAGKVPVLQHHLEVAQTTEDGLKK